MICVTLDYVKPTQFNFIWIIHCILAWCFFCSFTKMFVCYYRYIFIFHSYLQGSVEMHLWCGGIYNNHTIANCSQSVPVKEF